ncbi:MAG: guanine deaminase, partial [Gammaproteobacteria bacterium]
MTRQAITLDSENCDTAVRASIFHFVADPERQSDAYEYIQDGMLVLKQGLVTSLGEARSILDQLPDGTELHDYSGKLLMPGFFDTHTHYPQSEMIACYGAQLLEWLEKYTFPTERQFSDREYADRVADFFCQQLLRNGTTTSAVFATIHPESVDAIFSAAQQRDMCLIAGKVMMDRNAPEYLCDTAESSYTQSAELIERWHHRGRAHYAVTPRFAPTSSEQQLEAAGQLLQDFPDLYLQSHVAENHAEIAWVKKLFPDRRSYLDVYDHYGLLGERSVY